MHYAYKHKRKSYKSSENDKNEYLHDLWVGIYSLDSSIIIKGKIDGLIFIKILKISSKKSLRKQKVRYMMEINVHRTYI